MHAGVARPRLAHGHPDTSGLGTLPSEGTGRHRAFTHQPKTEFANYTGVHHRPLSSEAFLFLIAMRHTSHYMPTRPPSLVFYTPQFQA